MSDPLYLLHKCGAAQIGYFLSHLEEIGEVPMEHIYTTYTVCMSIFLSTFSSTLFILLYKLSIFWKFYRVQMTLSIPD